MSLASNSTSRALLSPKKGLDDTLIVSPPLSPALLEKDPLLSIGKPRKPVSKAWKLLARFVAAFGLVTIILVFWGGFWILFPGNSYARQTYGAAKPADDYEMAATSSLPDHPSPVLVTDENGTTKWTQSIPSWAHFPLRPKQYADMCSLSTKMTDYFESARSPTARATGQRRSLSPVNQAFMEVEEARSRGLLPNTTSDGTITQSTPISVVGGNNDLNYMPPCNRSMTFVMETSDAGFGSTLMNLWTAYGFAERESRAFFIDDTRWPYGTYTKFFKPPPLPNCAPPPASHIVPCPQHAQHIVVSEATLSYTFGSEFQAEFIHGKAPESQQMQNIYAFAHRGYSDLFSLIQEDADYATKRIAEIHDRVNVTGGLSIGVQVRRGDKHPVEKQYSRDYLPLERYFTEAQNVMIDRFSKTDAKTGIVTEDMEAEIGSKAFLASDDPDVFLAPELSTAQRAQDRIVLASATTLDEAGTGSVSNTKSNEHSPFHKYVPENSGWEGGFFAPLFWSLGHSDRAAKALSSNAQSAHGADVEQAEPETPESAMQLRELLGRAYLLDLNILSKSDAVVCAANGMGCRLLAVMMGWDAAIERHMWRNVDRGVSGWKGVVA